MSTLLTQLNELPEEEKEKIDYVDTWNRILVMLNSAYQFTNAAASELEYGMDLENKKIYINGDINLRDGIHFAQKLELVNRFSLMEDGEQTPITVIINSGGGDVYAMFAMIDAIRGCSVPVHTVGTGHIMSAASLILASGTGKRILTPNTSILLHEVSTVFGGDASSIHSNSGHIKLLQEKFISLYDEFSNKPASFWKRKIKGEWFFEPEDALKYGLVDYVTNDLSILEDREPTNEEIEDANREG